MIRPGIGRITDLTDGEFALFQGLVMREAGIALNETKRQLLLGRLSGRVRELGLPSFGAYYRHATADASGAEIVRLIDLVSTNETHFFREPAHFEFLAGRLLPRLTADAAAGRRSARLRVWSAACSTGQEPYSIAMTLLEHCPPDQGWDVEVVATDISTRVLRQAEAAVWPLEKAGEIPPALLKRYMLRGVGSQSGRMRAGPALRSVVRFARVNLDDESTYPGGGPFDLVFCRNVLIYFSPEGRAGVLERLLRRVTPDGHLVLGHAESMDTRRHPARMVLPAVYTPLPASA